MNQNSHTINQDMNPRKKTYQKKFFFHFNFLSLLTNFGKKNFFEFFSRKKNSYPNALFGCKSSLI